MNQTQPNSRTLIGLIIGAIVLVAGLLLISNAGRSGDSDTPPPSPTRVSQQPTATPQPQPSPTPQAQTRNEEEDPDGDGFLGESDFCPDAAGTFDGCPDSDNDGIADNKDACPTEGDLGYGIDGVGCPNPPTDRDGDGIFDNDDTCPDNADEGNGIDSVGCPIPLPPPLDRDNDGVPDEVDSCPDEGNFGAGVDASGCPIIIPPPLPPAAIAAISYSFEISPDLNCTILIVDEGGSTVASFPAVPDTNGIASGVFEYDPGVIINPEAQIGCVPNVAPAVMPYRFENVGADDNCSVQVVNIGDGDPATLSDMVPVTPDDNGVVQGEISILLGAGDTPEAVIMCIGTPPFLPPIEITEAVGEAIALQVFTFRAPEDFSPDAAFCDVLIFDANNQQLAVFTDSSADENGVIEVIFDYPVGSVVEPLSAQIFCVTADDFGEPEETPEITPQPAPEVTPASVYDLSADLQCLPLPNDARTFAQVAVNITATGNYRQSYQMTWVSGDQTVQNTVVFNMDTGTLFFTVPLGTGQATGTLTLVAYDDTATLIPDETWTFDVPMCAEPAYELTPNFWCQRDEQGDLTYLGVLINGTGNYPLYYQATWVSGDYTYGPNTSIWNSTLTTFNLAYEPGPGMTTGTLTLVPYSASFALMPELTIVYELDCTEPEVTPEPEETPDPETTPEPESIEAYGIELDKIWSDYRQEFNSSGLGAPALGSIGSVDRINNLISASSSIGTADCDWTGSFLDCRYSVTIDGNTFPIEGLIVPVGESYTVNEAPIEGWVVAQGVGTFTYDECQANTIDVGDTYEPVLEIVGYCYHRVVNTIPDSESAMLVEIDKDWVVSNVGGLNAPAQGGGFGPDEDILEMIVATSDYGTLTCDWYGDEFGGYLDCFMQFTSRPPWYDGFNELPVPPGGSYTVTENLPEGWSNLRGLGTFSINTCVNGYPYTEYYEVDGEEQSIRVFECWHEVVNQAEEIDTENYYGVQFEKIWSEDIETALQNRGLNSPALGTGGNGPNQNYYPLIYAYSSYGQAWCDWYSGYGLSCYYDTYGNAPFPAYNYLLVGRGESFTVTEAPIDGYVNVRGLGTFDESSCDFINTFDVGYGQGYIELPICRHEVENMALDTSDYYRVVVEKYWHYNYGGLDAPAPGGGYDPFMNIPNFITLDSSIGTGTCNWVIDGYGDGDLVCSYSAKDGQTMPDTTGLWVPVGESYTVSENPPAGWEVTSGTGTFNECPSYTNGNTCYHTIHNNADELPAYRVYIAKFWEGFACGDDYWDECEYDEASANAGLNAPLGGGFYGAGPDTLIRNIITATSDVSTLVCDWVPDYYDAYFDVTFGELECRITSLAEGYPPYYSGLWVPAGGSYTVTENVPAGYTVLFGTGTFSIEECLENGFYAPFGNANVIPTGGEYYEDSDECLHVVMNAPQEVEPTPEVTPTEDITPVVTPTEDITPEVTAVPTDQPTPVTSETPVVPTEQPSPEPTPEGVCGDYTLASDGFPIINLSNAPCGDDSEGAVVNFSPIQTGGAVCIAEALYHSNGGGTWDIWRTADGMEAENLSNNDAGIISMAPTRSPNGRYVVYASNADGDWELYLLDLQNSDAAPMQLTNNGQAIDLDPVFSPSGRFIAYESNVDGNWEIRVIDLTTGEKFRVTNHPANDINPFWHPDGDRLLFQSDRTGKWQIFSATTIAGATALELLSDGLGDDFDPAYSHDGEQITFRSERNGEMGIYIMDADGGDVRKVSLDGYSASTPVWDTSNRYIAYQASKAGESLNDIFVYDTLTGETRQLTSSVGEMANVQDVAPTWLCNSTTVIFTSDVSGNNRLYALNALPMSAPPVDLTGMRSWTENEFNNRDPQNTPSEENGSRMGALPPRR